MLKRSVSEQFLFLIFNAVELWVLKAYYTAKLKQTICELCEIVKKYVRSNRHSVVQKNQ